MSNIKSKEFYDEAENMQIGWGEYLKSIDELKDKVKYKKNITLREYRWILYGEYYPISIRDQFYEYCKSLNYTRKKMVYECWNGLFENWIKNV